MSKPVEGWWRPDNSTRWHYLRGGRSLCGKWACLGQPVLAPGDDGHPDNCAACRKKRLAEIRKAVQP